MGGRTTRLVATGVVALLGLALVGLLGLAVLGGRDARRDADRAERSDGEAALSHVRGLTRQLATERNWVALEVLGMTDAVALSPGSGADSPQNTDAAIADALAAVDAHPDDDALTLLAPTLDALSDLQEIRDQADSAVSRSGGGSLADMSDALAVGDAYGVHIAALHDAGREIALSIDDPEMRAGAQLQVTATRQHILTIELLMDLMLGATGDGINTPDEIAALAARAEEWDAGVAELEAAPPPYDTVIDDRLPDTLVAQLPVHTERALTEGTVNLGEFLDLTTAEDSFAGMDDAIAERQAAIVDDRVEAARDREDRSELLAAAALAGLVVVAGVVITLVVTGRSRPSAGPPTAATTGFPPPPPPPVASRHF